MECEAFVDGVTIRVDAETAYAPDVAVRCGERLSDDMMAIHHERDAAGAISTKIIHDGVVRLDPSGIELAEIFEPLS